MRLLHIFALVCLLALGANANPGDTTIIVGHQNLEMPYTGWYNTVLQLPTNNVRYRKAYLEYTYGKYVCPGNPQYCGSWDYIVNFQLRPYRAGWDADSFEIARGITPYATTSTYFPNTWTHTYYEDITNYEPLLRDSALLKVWYGGYSYGFTISTRIILIEGNPEKDVVAIKNIYPLGSPTYGGTVSIDSNYLTPKTLTLHNDANKANLVFRITGHGANANDGCGEFCSKYFDVLHNGNNIFHKDIWRTCGYCDIPAQTGTWIFDRANWCPGERVPTFDVPLGAVTAGNTYTVDVDMEPYTYAGSQAAYNIEGQIIEYKDMRQMHDAALEHILSPSTINDFKKYNPNCSGPLVQIRNAGANVVSFVEITHGIVGSTNWRTDLWSGTLQPNETALVQLTAHDGAELWPDSSRFSAKILRVNALTDGNPANNENFSIYRSVPTLPHELIISMRTNNTAASSGATNETSWKLYNDAGTIIAQRINAAHNTTYDDTVVVGEGCYKLVVKDTGYMDGLSFWYYQYYNTNPGSGYIRLKNAKTGAIIGNTVSQLTQKSYNGDFGAGFEYNFKIKYPQGLHHTQPIQTLELWPNPSHDIVYIDGIDEGLLEISVYNTLGQQVLVTKTTERQLSIKQLPAGNYTLRATSNGKQMMARLSKL